MYGDTAVIRRLATGLRDRADEVRAEATRLVGAAEQVLWDGRAAEAMRANAGRRAGQLRAAADEHDGAAEALLAHAAEVDRLTARIAEISRRFAALADAARSRLAGLVDAVTPDPVDELLASFDPPPIGHLAWLEVPDRLPGIL